MTALLSARNLAVGYGDAPVLTGVDFALDAGEIVTIVGPNGSGKSTFLRALLGVVPPSAGSVSRRPGLRIGYVPQRLALDPTMPMTVARFLSLPTRQSRKTVADALARTGVSGVERQQLTQLSGGQLQRVFLARALLSNPEVLILDEPTQGLDQPGTAALYRLIEEVRADLGCAVLLVSHDLHVVMRAADRVICLNGHICCEGAPRVVSETPEYRALFGLGTGGTFALYPHTHDHDHDHDHDHHHHHGSAAE